MCNYDYRNVVAFWHFSDIVMKKCFRKFDHTTDIQMYFLQFKRVRLTLHNLMSWNTDNDMVGIIEWDNIYHFISSSDLL